MGLGRHAAARWTALGCLLVGAVVVLLASDLATATARPLTGAVQSATSLAAATLFLWRAVHSVAAVRLSRALLGLVMVAAAVVIAVSSGLWAVGSGNVATGNAVIQLAMLPLAVLALLSYPVSRPGSGSWARMLLDGVVVAAALWFATYALLIRPSGLASNPEGWVGLLPAAVDVVVVGLLAGVLPQVDRRHRRELLTVAAGLICLLAADVLLDALAPGGGNAPLAALAEAGLVLLLVASATRTGPAVAVDGPRDRLSRLLGALPHLAVSVAVVVAVQVALTGGELRGGQILVAIACVVALMLRHSLGTGAPSNGSCARARSCSGPWSPARPT